jgi:15-cis-phytoene synthase
MQDAYAHCEALVREADKDRFLASLFAPAGRRPHLYALHAFHIEIARVGQMVREVLAGEIRLQWWRDALAGEARGEPAGNPVAAALLDTVARCDLQRDALETLIDAHARDLYGEPFATLAELETYGRQTAAAAFALAAQVLDANANTVDAASAGIAYALAGFLQTFAREAARGRVFIPLDVLDRHEVRRDEVTAGTESAGLRPALAEIAAAARVRLAEAMGEWNGIPLAARPAFLPLALIEPLLARSERNRDPFRPIALPPWRRQWLLWRAARRGRF